MMRLWQRLAVNPSGSLQLLDAAFWLKFAAWRDASLRAQLSEAWAWCFKENKPSSSLATRSHKHARDVGIREKQQFFPETDRIARLKEAMKASMGASAPKAATATEEDGIVYLRDEVGNEIAAMHPDVYRRLSDAPPGQKESA